MLNFVTACVDCNAGKSDRLVDQAIPSRQQHARLKELQAMDDSIRAIESKQAARLAELRRQRESATVYLGIESGSVLITMKTVDRGDMRFGLSRDFILNYFVPELQRLCRMLDISEKNT
jgi:D-serine deaminase-like pyridoxal phosphate-dependent protein